MYGFVNKFVVRKTGRKLGIYGVILAHQKLETSSIAYALDLAGWALRICSVVKYIEALTLSDWAFAHKAPPGCLFFFHNNRVSHRRAIAP